ncbi:hypothetical protein HK104_004597, partial [Borealophlyctis nickersoniae]
DEISTLISPLASRQYVYSKVEAGQTFPTFSYVQQHYYNRDEMNSMVSTLAPKDSVYTKLEADQRYKPIDYQIDLSGYCSRDEVNTIASTLASKNTVYTKTESDQRYKSIEDPFIFPTNVGVNSSDGKRRYYVGHNGPTYNFSPEGFDWRNVADTKSVLIVNNEDNGVVNIPGTLKVGQVTLSNTTDDALIVSGAIYSGLNKIATEIFVTDALQDYMPWQVIYDTFAVSTNVWSKAQADGRFVLKTLFDEFTLGVYSIDQVNNIFAQSANVFSKSQSDARYMPVSVLYDTFAVSTNVWSKSDADERFVLNTFFDEFSQSVYSKDQSDAQYLPITYSPPAHPDLSPYLLTSTANTLYKGTDWQPSGYALTTDLENYLPTSFAQTVFSKDETNSILSNYYTKSQTDGIYLQPSSLGSYYTKTQSDSRYILTGSPIVFPTNVGHDSSDGKRRFYFANNGRTYNYSPDGFQWRNSTDTNTLLTLANDGMLTTGTLATGNVALGYNILFLASLNDSNHFISHGMSAVATQHNFNHDGILVHSGIGGGALAQSGQTALRWLNGVVTIPGSLKVSGGVDIPEVSLLPKNNSDTRPAFQVQAFSHDNQSIFFDANWNGTDLIASFGSFFRIRKFNGNLWIGGGTAAIGSTANMTDFIQMSPSGQITLMNNSADALKVNGSIYSGGNKVATEVYVNSAVSASKPWENKASLELNVGSGDTHCFIDFHSSSTAADYNFRIVRDPGTNSPARIQQQGTEPIIIEALQATGLSLSPTNNAVASGGSVVFSSSVRHDGGVAINGYTSQQQQQGYGCLDVFGVGTVASTQSANVSLFCKYACVSHTYFTHSDARWKENIRPVSGLDVIDKIDVRVFDWKDALLGKNQIGFIAQEVREYLPQYVYELPTDTPTDDPPLSVDYQAMNCLLWQVVKDLKQEIAEIKRTIKGTNNTVSLNLNTNDSTSISTGSLVVPGGVGVAKTISAKTISVGSSSTDGSELLKFNTDRPWSFFQQSAGSSSVLALRSSTTAKSFCIQDPTLQNIFICTVGAANGVTVAATADAVSIASGALHVAGGVGIAKNVWIGGSLTMPYTLNQPYITLLRNDGQNLLQVFPVGTLSTSYVRLTAASGSKGRIAVKNGVIDYWDMDSTGITTTAPLSITNTTDAGNSTTGALTVSGGVGIAKKLYVGSTITCTSLTQTSDRNLKEDITALDDAVGFVNSLQPVSYRFKRNSRKDKSMGLIAQDVLTACKKYTMPGDLVKEELDGHYTLDYSQLLAPLIRSHQQMFNMLITLAARLERLEN